MNTRTTPYLFVLGAAVVAGGSWALARALPANDHGKKNGDAVAKALESGDFTHAFERVADSIRTSVVTIASSRAVDMPTGFAPFTELFGGRMPPQRGENAPREHGMGSGVIVRADGFVLTNAHVVDGADDLEVNFSDGHSLPAHVVGTDKRTDLAVVRVDAKDLTPASFADSDDLKVGQWVAAFGAPFGLDQTMSAGIVSAKGRIGLHLSEFEDFVQTDAAINPGNSGGPLVDLAGRVVGIDSAIATRSGGSQGVGFAIPSNIARSIADSLIADGKVVRGWIGLAIQDVTPDLARSFGLDKPHGALVGDVSENSPAQKADLHAGDVITAIDGREVSGMTAFRNSIAERHPGTDVRLTVWRDGRSREVDARLGTSPDDGQAPAVVASKMQGFGLELADPSVAAQHGISVRDGAEGAVIVGVTPGSAAESAGLVAGDEIVEIEHKDVHGLSDAARELKDRRESGALLRIRREGQYLWMHLPAAR